MAMSVAEGSLRQLLDMWHLLVTEQGSASISDGDVSVRWADSDFRFYNCLALTRSSSNTKMLTDALKCVVATMRSREKLGYLWVFEDLLEPPALAALPSLAGEVGLSRAMTATGMAGDVSRVPDPVHPELRFERVSTAAHLADYAELNALAYGSSIQAAQAAFSGSQLWCEGIHAYTAYKQGVPVSCAGSCPVEGRFFVILVATRPDFQSRGFGEVVTRKAIFEGMRSTGLTRATLHATEAGRPVYERIGLKATAGITLYELAQSSPSNVTDLNDRLNVEQQHKSGKAP